MRSKRNKGASAAYSGRRCRLTLAPRKGAGSLRQFAKAQAGRGKEGVQMKKTITLQEADPRVVALIEINDKQKGAELSICGELHSTKRGSSYGQIHFSHYVDSPLAKRLDEIHDRWHLNGMRAGCSHQRAADWGKKVLEVVKYTLTAKAYDFRRDALLLAERAAVEGVVALLTDMEKALLSPDWFRTLYALPEKGTPLYGCYEEESREEKTSRWVKETEHPDGVLMKACPVCGYKYGSEWLYEKLPQEIINKVEAL